LVFLFGTNEEDENTMRMRKRIRMKYIQGETVRKSVWDRERMG